MLPQLYRSHTTDELSDLLPQGAEARQEPNLYLLAKIGVDVSCMRFLCPHALYWIANEAEAHYEELTKPGSRFRESDVHFFGDINEDGNYTYFGPMRYVSSQLLEVGFEMEFRLVTPVTQRLHHDLAIISDYREVRKIQTDTGEMFSQGICNSCDALSVVDST
jgi:hypothetical protein